MYPHLYMGEFSMAGLAVHFAQHRRPAFAFVRAKDRIEDH